MTYPIVVADPPWRFASNSKAKPGRNAMRHYPCMSDTEIGAIPMLDILAPDALLFMWTTAPMLARTMGIVSDYWNLRYVSNAVWVKPRIGTGFWFRNRHEHCLLYRRGRYPRPSCSAPFPDSAIQTQTAMRHSRKPTRLHEWIEAAYPDAPKLEMFARRERPGWDCWGNEVADRGLIPEAAA